MGNLQLSDLILGSWGTAWQPDDPAHRSWLDIEEPHPPDDETRASFEAQNRRASLDQHNAYGEDVLRLRRLIVGG